ncbi:nuclease [Punctularia strigosozonata HHB-11173 SS5]|uniref:nuclease n=1 Tax=Punctularia strigosozonata (strain HHB-11173) TaxID=741275 RepID=UPI0004417412|nr:nuclease [Punctularia strigosozonata HHB-11173 SS5]EIN05748.1 nuclease [Punctularia strigosozonata HHB-11173 SS5]
MSWPWSSAAPAEDIPPEEIDTDASFFEKEVDHAVEKLDGIPTPLLLFSAFALGAASTYACIHAHRRFWRRLPNGDWITPEHFAKKRWIKGVVTSVGDADNFRLYHTPGFGWRWPLKFRRVPSIAKELKDETIHIRMAGIDAPEAAHFGRPSMPYAAEALAWLKQTVDGKAIYCQLIRRDQYFRIVAVPVLPPRLLPAWLKSGRCISLEMLHAGWASTYQQANAEYGQWGKEEFLRIEHEAKVARRGQWANGISGETPAEYKRRHAGSADAAEKTTKDSPKPPAKKVGYGSADAAEKTAKPSPKPPAKKVGLLGRLFGRS